MGVRGGSFKKGGTYTYMYLIHFVVHQKLTQHYKATLPQFKTMFRHANICV